jgi:hypothetical protein
LGGIFWRKKKAKSKTLFVAICSVDEPNNSDDSKDFMKQKNHKQNINITLYLVIVLAVRIYEIYYYYYDQIKKNLHISIIILNDKENIIGFIVGIIL